MITLTLLHPVQSTPVQSWSFEQDPVIRIGRAVDNHVVLYSAVVSRYHVEIRLTDDQWEVVNLGTNGTYVDGKRVHQSPLSNGSIVRLARSGPNIQIYIEGQTPTTSEVSGDLISGKLSSRELGSEDLKAVPLPLSSDQSEDLSLPVSSGATQEFAVVTELPAPPEEVVVTAPAIRPSFYVGGRYPLFNQTADQLGIEVSTDCNHQRSPADALICTHCGLPIRPLQTIGPYQVLKPLSVHPEGSSVMAWREGHTVVLKTLHRDGRAHPTHRDTWMQEFESQARLLCQLEHPGMPKVFEAFEFEGQPYLVSEMIYGPSLKDWIVQHGPVSQYQAVQWMLEISRLLGYLHQQHPPYLHRSIQPTNLIRPKVAHGFSQVVLVNFGELSALAGEPRPSTRTLGYAAPEQQQGEASTASDLYGLGATLVYCLTGQDPDAFYQLGDDQFRLQVKDAPNVSSEIADIVEQLTDPNPQQRFASAALVVDALQHLL